LTIYLDINDINIIAIVVSVFMLGAGVIPALR